MYPQSTMPPSWCLLEPPPGSLRGDQLDIVPLPLKRKASSPRGMNQAPLRYYCGCRPSHKAESFVSLSKVLRALWFSLSWGGLTGSYQWLTYPGPSSANNLN